jgi:AcrR family transcriptional regulator
MAPAPAPATVRTRILDSALACFIEAGYEQTTIARIRERSEVTNGALFHHFASKEAIADALYVEALASFQDGLWALLRRKPRALRSAMRGVLGHQLTWTEENQDLARFLYMRGEIDWNTPAGVELAARNRSLAEAYREWMAPLVRSGQLRSTSMVMLTAIVGGPAHAIARRWLAGQLREPLHAYLDELVHAAVAALSATPGTTRLPVGELPRGARVRLELIAEDGSVLADGEALAELTAGGSPAGRRRRSRTPGGGEATRSTAAASTRRH